MRIELTPQQVGSENAAVLAAIDCGCATLAVAWETITKQLKRNAAVLAGLNEKEQILLHSLRLRSIDRSYLAPSSADCGKCSIVYIVVFG